MQGLSKRRLVYALPSFRAFRPAVRIQACITLPSIGQLNNYSRSPPSSYSLRHTVQGMVMFMMDQLKWCVKAPPLSSP
jgi:hypothetical protein